MKNLWIWRVKKTFFCEGKEVEKGSQFCDTNYEQTAKAGILVCVEGGGSEKSSY